MVINIYQFLGGKCIMKFSTRSAAIIAALAMATTGALALNQTQADAATVATTHSGSYSMLYNAQGAQVRNRALAANTPWLVGKTATINGETMYQVSTDEYLRAADSTLSGDQAQPQQSNKTVLTIGKYMAALYRDDTNRISNRALANGSSWQVAKTITNSKGDTYYQVSTHEFVKKSSDNSISGTVNPEYIADFGLDKDSSSTNTNTGSTDTSTDTNTNTSTNTGSDTNTGSTTTDNNSGNTTTAPSTGTDTSTSTSTGSSVNASDYQQAILNDINEARASKGLQPLQLNATLTTGAAIRAKESAQVFEHTRPDGSDRSSVFNDAKFTRGTTGENLDDIRSIHDRDAANLANEHKNGFLGEAGQPPRQQSG